MARGEYAGVEEDLDSVKTLDEHDDASIETAVDELKVAEDVGDDHQDENLPRRQSSATQMRYGEDVPLLTEFGIFSH
ncbi:hypothetical protein BG003_007697 [Podila horticola]|nr:hypothetical protein BG003_007697 [Podila horticola]